MSKGWLEKFKTCFHLRCFELHGEAAYADMHGVGFALQILPCILKEYDAKVSCQIDADASWNGRFTPLVH